MSEKCPKCPKSNRRLPSLQYRARTLAPYCKPHARKCRQIPSRAFCTENFTKCPTQYLPSLSYLCPHTLMTITPQCSAAQGIYVIICLFLRSNRQSLSRQQGIILIKTANAVIVPFSIRYTIDRKWIFSDSQEILTIMPELERDRKWHATAGNKHIGKMAALPPPENMCGIASLSPAGKYSVATISPSRWDDKNI